ncbi:MAG: pentapeptide repeat-containing protein, partial [Methanobacterium sp.]
RYIGGKNYENNLGQILYFLDRFIIDVYNAIDTGFNHNDIRELENYLDKNISTFKTFSKYDNFIVEFPSISIQVDQNGLYDVFNAYYDRIFSKLFTLIDSTDDLKDCIINYVTTTQRIEVIDATIKSTMNIKDFDFINCIISDGIFEDCQFINSEIKNCQLVKSKVHGCDITSSKVLNCKVEASQLKDCFFMNGYLNADMEGGVLRSGKLGPYATVSSDTKVVSDTENFFDTRFDDDQLMKDEKDLGEIKAFKK